MLRNSAAEVLGNDGQVLLFGRAGAVAVVLEQLAGTRVVLNDRRSVELMGLSCGAILVTSGRMMVGGHTMVVGCGSVVEDRVVAAITGGASGKTLPNIFPWLGRLVIVAV